MITPLKVDPNMNMGKVVFGDKKELVSLISDYFMLQTAKGEIDSVQLFTVICHRWVVTISKLHCSNQMDVH